MFRLSIIVFAGLCALLYASCKQKNTNEDFVMPTNNGKGVVMNFKKACFFVSSQKEIDSLKKKYKIEIELPTNREIEQIKLITDFIGLPQNFGIYKGNVRNAMATVVNERRIIIFRKDLLRRVDRAGGDEYWSSMFILAHEIGHHLCNHFSTDSLNSKDAELQADFFAGSALCRLGASLEATVKPLTFGFLTASPDDNTHPDKKIRIASVTDGWNRTNYQLDNSFATPPPPPDDDLINVKDPLIYNPEDFDFVMDDDMIDLNYLIKHKFYQEFEGIITRIHLYDDLRESYSELPNIEKIQIELTRDYTPKEYYEGENAGIPEGIRIWINVPHGEEMCHACIRNYLAILVRGRRIRIKTYRWDSGQNFYLFYLKELKR